MSRNALWQAVLETTESAAHAGALKRIPTRIEFVEEDGVRFQVHLVQQLERKARAKIAQRQTGANPFLPYEEAMFVADVSDTHVCLLNKFNVVDHHLLIVTREFEDQETPLTVPDFEAMWVCLREFDSLAFYNSGEIAGASQAHKHIQQVPLPLGGCTQPTLIDSLRAEARSEGSVASLPFFPFRHAFVPWANWSRRRRQRRLTPPRRSISRCSRTGTTRIGRSHTTFSSHGDGCSSCPERSKGTALSR